MATESIPHRRHRWPNLILQSSQPTFVLSPSKRIRVVNAAWEQLTGLGNADAVGMACLRKGPTDDLFRTLAPPADAKKQVVTIRKASPGKTVGPPWWDLTFVPLPQPDGTVGYLGLIEVTSPALPHEKPIILETVASVRDKHARQITIDWFHGSTPAQQKLSHQLAHAARSTDPVWLQGEPGCGKETAARAIHQASPVRDRAFFGLDCAGSPAFLAESIVFGRGSFGESGRLGTLYLKEPSTLPRDAQQQLLTWLDGPGKAVRMICGSRQPAIEHVTSGELIPEFLARYTVLELTILPLCERLADLANILDRISKRTLRTIASETQTILKQHTWPGNFRELLDTLASAEGDGAIRIDHLPRDFRESAQLRDAPPIKADPGPKLDDVLIQVERRLLLVALQTNGGNATKAADWLGIPRTRFLRRAESLGVKQ